MNIKLYLIFFKKIYGECTEITKCKMLFSFHDLCCIDIHRVNMKKAYVLMWATKFLKQDKHDNGDPISSIFDMTSLPGSGVTSWTDFLEIFYNWAVSSTYMATSAYAWTFVTYYFKLCSKHLLHRKGWTVRRFLGCPGYPPQMLTKSAFKLANSIIQLAFAQ